MIHRIFIKRITSLVLCWSVIAAAAVAQTKIEKPDSFEAPVSFVSEGDTLRGTMFVAERDGPRPTLLFLNGFTGSPELPDHHKLLLEAGANVLHFPYRGTYGSDGLYSAENALVDAEAALVFLRSSKVRTAYHVDPDAIVPYGPSFGGWVALSLAARSPGLECVAATIIANIGAFGQQWSASEPYRAAWRRSLAGMTAGLPIRMEGGPEGVMTNIMERADDYDLVSLTPVLRDRTVLLFGAEQDELAPMARHYQPVANALIATGMERLTLLTAPGGHNEARPEWNVEIIRWLYEDCLDERYRPADLDQTLAALEAQIRRVSIAEIVYATLEAEGIEAARQQHRELRTAAPDSIEFGEDAVQSANDPLNALGYRLLQAGAHPEAIAVFEMNVEAYPDEPNPYDSLGDGYSAAGRLEDAKKSYARAVELARQQDHPNLETYRENLQRVTQQLEQQKKKESGN